MKSNNKIKISRILEKEENLQNPKASKNLDDNTFECAQNDKDCWHRYSSAMGDCV